MPALLAPFPAAERAALQALLDRLDERLSELEAVTQP
jgi:hypothetical protein